MMELYKQTLKEKLYLNEIHRQQHFDNSWGFKRRRMDDGKVLIEIPVRFDR